jgi:hypothetical protein
MKGAKHSSRPNFRRGLKFGYTGRRNLIGAAEFEQSENLAPYFSRTSRPVRAET